MKGPTQKIDGIRAQTQEYKLKQSAVTRDTTSPMHTYTYLLTKVEDGYFHKLITADCRQLCIHSDGTTPAHHAGKE